MPIPCLFCQDQLDKGHVQREDNALEVILEQQGREEIQPVGRLLKLIIIWSGSCLYTPIFHLSPP